MWISISHHRTADGFRWESVSQKGLAGVDHELAKHLACSLNLLLHSEDVLDSIGYHAEHFWLPGEDGWTLVGRHSEDDFEVGPLLGRKEYSRPEEYAYWMYESTFALPRHVFYFRSQTEIEEIESFFRSTIKGDFLSTFSKMPFLISDLVDGWRRVSLLVSTSDDQVRKWLRVAEKNFKTKLSADIECVRIGLDEPSKNHFWNHEDQWTYTCLTEEELFLEEPNALDHSEDIPF